MNVSSCDNVCRQPYCHYLNFNKYAELLLNGGTEEEEKTERRMKSMGGSVELLHVILLWPRLRWWHLRMHIMAEHVLLSTAQRPFWSDGSCFLSSSFFFFGRPAQIDAAFKWAKKQKPRVDCHSLNLHCWTNGPRGCYSAQVSVKEHIHTVKIVEFN